MRRWIIPVLVFSLLAGWLCSPSPDMPTGPGEALEEGCLSISPRRAQELIDKWPRLIILDARTPAEYHEERLPEALLLDVTDEAQMRRQLRNLDRERPCLVYCRSGARSRKACAILQDAGFRQIYHLQGGYHQWPKPE